MRRKEGKFENYERRRTRREDGKFENYERRRTRREDANTQLHILPKISRGTSDASGFLV
jgi:hypothetical protein